MEQQARPEQQIWFQKEIKELLKQDKKSPPAQGSIVFTGSSIFRLWSTLGQDMSPLPVVNRAFGGARTWDLLHYMDSIVLPSNPATIACYCGSNDLEFGSRAEDIALRFSEFCKRAHEVLPETTVLFVSINKAPQKIEKWAEIDKANRLVQDYCSLDKKMGFIDINSVFFNAQGQSRPELYSSDGLYYYRYFSVGIRHEVKPVAAIEFGA